MILTCQVCRQTKDEPKAILLKQNGTNLEDGGDLGYLCQTCFLEAASRWPDRPLVKQGEGYIREFSLEFDPHV